MNTIAYSRNHNKYYSRQFKVNYNKLLIPRVDDCRIKTHFFLYNLHLCLKFIVLFFTEFLNCIILCRTLHYCDFNKYIYIRKTNKNKNDGKY